ncbi:hypothetical protein [Rhodococcus sp. IEGM 1374]|uniref:hypothetical protein n=1 Tax=Rhodococcus sp. IEGM 1374 TaxID=3082221 RepID=UPI0029548F8B|nr:hypothetical protein [Rhodococcus sp. IEGM 1374]MDV7992104.1 hypothetical protein [Rhodococcus sp. IEGM 1374]
MSLNHEVPHHIDHLADTVDLRPVIASLAVQLAFEDMYQEEQERLITRPELIANMEALAPVILQRGTA